MNDLISRQAAISEIMEDIEDKSLHDDPATPEDYAEGYDEGIRNAAAIVLQMPSAQPGWIPVTERLPEYGTTVLTCDHDGEYEINHIIDEEDGEWFLNGAVAWMPLPKPWEGDANG